MALVQIMMCLNQCLTINMDTCVITCEMTFVLEWIPQVIFLCLCQAQPCDYAYVTPGNLGALIFLYCVCLHRRTPSLWIEVSRERYYHVMLWLAVILFLRSIIDHLTSISWCQNSTTLHNHFFQHSNYRGYFWCVRKWLFLVRGGG